MGRNYDPADIGNYLDEAESFQTFSNDPMDADHYMNSYSGFDNLKAAPITDQHIYALVHDGNIAQMNGNKPLDVCYFFDQATYDKFVDPKTGKHDAAALNDALQLDPAGYPTYRDSIICFDVHPEKAKGGVLKLPVGTCTANTQLGGGGAHEAFAPKDISIDLQNSGVLEVNRSKSHLHTGYNTKVEPVRQAKVQKAIAERQQNCIDNGTKHHNTGTKYANEFTPTPNQVAGKPFEATKETGTKDVQSVLKGLHNLQKYLDQAEQSDGLSLSSDDFCFTIK